MSGRRKGTSVPQRKITSPTGPALQPEFILFALLSSRALSVALNIIHDCDEVYNYWEPLHNMVYGFGLQTWEYSSQYALRSYFYLQLHQAVAAPLAWLLGSGKGKIAVFYGVRAALGLVSAATEASLVRAVDEHVSQAVSRLLLAFLCVSSGMFVSSTAFLPSSFAAYAMTYAAASMLHRRYQRTILASAVGIVWGWCVAAVAFIPFALVVLARAPVGRSLASAAMALAVTLAPLALADRAYYGRSTVSLLNFVRYNVVGGGQSALYGVEGWSYYLRNGAVTLQAMLPLALLLPLLGALCRRSRARQARAVLLVCSPAYLWLAALSCLPHKEERFLYVVYPLLCLAAAGSTEIVLHAISRGASHALGKRFGRRVTAWATCGALAMAALLGAARSAALVVNYGAPMHIYRGLPEVPHRTGALAAPALTASEPIAVCVGAEWHRYPSSFFLPGDAYRLQFIASGFDGLLPRPFNASEAADEPSPHFNDRNVADEANRWRDASRCDYLVTLQDGDAILDAPGDPDAWTSVASHAFVDIARSTHTLFRAFYVPALSARRNHVVRYVLLRRAPRAPA